MSRFRGARMDGLTAYVPGEQPKDMRYIKLNTNESPFPPSEGVRRAVAEQIDLLRLYSDPDATALTQAVAAFYSVDPRQVLMTNGSDEILNFAFMAFGDTAHPFAFADVTYGFYPVFARLNGVPYRTIPLREDFSIDPGDYANLNANLVIANPNAPTGLALPRAAIEQIVRSNPDHVVVVDEAYVDFGGESCIPLVEKYDNLLVKSAVTVPQDLSIIITLPRLASDEGIAERVNAIVIDYFKISRNRNLNEIILFDLSYSLKKGIEIIENVKFTVPVDDVVLDKDQVILLGSVEITVEREE